MNRKTLTSYALAFSALLLILLGYYFVLNRQVKQQVQQETQNIIQTAENTKQESFKQSLAIERVVQAVNATQAVLRLSIDTYIAENGALPNQLEDIGFPPNWQPDAALERVEMQGNSVFILHFRPEYTQQGSVTLAIHQPETLGQTDGFFTGIRFDCHSSDFAFIQEYLPDCLYFAKP